MESFELILCGIITWDLIEKNTGQLLATHSYFYLKAEHNTTISLLPQHHELLLRQFDENFFLLNNQIKKQKNRMSSCKLQHVFRLSLPVPLQP